MHIVHLLMYLMLYVRGTVYVILVRFGGSMLDLHIFTDADRAGDILTRISTTGYVDH